MTPRAVGLLGGSFDPVHRAHLELAERALVQVPLDEVWFLPAAQSPLKRHAPRATAPQRLQMLRLALAGRAELRICTWELDHPGPHRSARTVAALAAAHPECHFHFLMGEDSFRSLDRWYRADRLARLAPLVVLPRPGSEGERPATYAGTPVRWLEGEALDWASTAVRRTLARGERPEGLPDAVRRYVEAEGLYREAAEADDPGDDEENPA